MMEPSRKKRKGEIFTRIPNDYRNMEFPKTVSHVTAYSGRDTRIMAVFTAISRTAHWDVGDKFLIYPHSLGVIAYNTRTMIPQLIECPNTGRLCCKHVSCYGSEFLYYLGFRGDLVRLNVGTNQYKVLHKSVDRFFIDGNNMYMVSGNNLYLFSLSCPGDLVHLSSKPIFKDIIDFVYLPAAKIFVISDGSEIIFVDDKSFDVKFTIKCPLVNGLYRDYKERIYYKTSTSFNSLDEVFDFEKPLKFFTNPGDYYMEIGENEGDEPVIYSNVICLLTSQHIREIKNK